MTAPAVNEECVCGDPRSRHKLGKGGCRGCELGCGKFESAGAATDALDVAALQEDLERLEAADPDVAVASAAVDEAAAAILQPRRDLGTALAELRAAERERDALAARLAQAHDALTRIDDGDDDDFTTLEGTVEHVARRYRAVAAAEDQADAEIQRLRAELVSARAELEHHREDGRVRARALVERSAELAAARAELEQERAGLAATVTSPTDVLSSYIAWQCLDCGARYRVRESANDHPHPTVPVTVTIARRPAS